MYTHLLHHCVVVLIVVALYQDLKKARKKDNYPLLN